MRTYKHKSAVIAIIAVILAVAACAFTVEKMEIVGTPTANGILEFNTQLSLKINKDQTTKLVFGILVPKMWDVAASEAEMKVSTSGRPVAQKGQPDITDVPMHVVKAGDTDPVTGNVWKTAFQSMYGSMGNTGPVEWVVFESDEEFKLEDDDANTFTATVNAKIPTNGTNVKFFLASAFCGSTSGFYPDESNGNYYSTEALKITAEVTGGSGGEDFTVAHFTSTTPQEFRYGDIVCINFTSYIDETSKTPLAGVSEVYMCGNAELEDGTIVSVSEPLAENLMDQESDFLFTKYIYPRTFFSLDEKAVIKNMYVWFTNSDKTYIATEASNPLGYRISQGEASILN